MTDPLFWVTVDAHTATGPGETRSSERLASRYFYLLLSAKFMVVLKH